MAVTSRHSRYVIGVAIGVLCTISFLLSRPHSLPYFSITSKALESPVRKKLELQEDNYVTMVQSRHALVRKFGPVPEKLETFPKPGSWTPYVLWDFFPALFNCPYETDRIGVLGEGGKWVCGLSRLVDKPNCIVYSAGISHESSFEAEIIRRTKCEVFGFDFSVEKFGPEVENYGLIRAKSRFFPYAISGTDSHEAHPPAWTIQSLMKEHGHTFVDILKVDIEGHEFQALASLVKYYREHNQPLPFGQLQLEIHANTIKFSEFLKWWEDLEEAGLRPFWTEPNILYSNWFRPAAPSYTEYSFLNIVGNHAIIMD